MYQKFIFIFSFTIVLLLSGCFDGGSGGVTVDSVTAANGTGAKGPFVKDSVVKAYKLDDNGSRSLTVTPVSTTTINDIGKYKLSSIPWSGATELEITGKYFNENTGTTSATVSTLTAIVDVKAGEELTANINVLTDLAAKRSKVLMLSGSTLDDAKDEAKKSVVELFNITLPTGTNLEDLDLTDGSSTNAEANANLLLISAAIAKAPDLLDSIKDAIADGNVTNDSAGIQAFSDLAQKIKDVNITEVAQNLKDELDVTDPPNTDDTSDENSTLDINTYIPVISDIATIHKLEDDPAFDVVINIEDNDTNPAYNNAQITSVTSSDISIATVSLLGTTLKITPVANAYGLVTISLTVSDGTYQSSKSFDVDIASVNDAPVLSPINNITKDEDFMPFSVPLSATDIEGDSITFDANSSDTSIVTVAVRDFVLEISPVANAHGSVTINVSANDGNGGVDIKSFVLDVNSVLDPVIVSDFTGSIAENAIAGSMVGQVGITTVGGDTISSIALSGVGSEYFDIDNLGYIKLNSTGAANIDYETVTDYNLTVTVNNGLISTAFANIAITDVADVPPKINSTTITIPETATGIVGNILNSAGDRPVTMIIKSGNDGNFTIDSNGNIQVTGSLDYESIQNYTLDIEATSDSGSDSATVVINLTNVNDNPPVIVGGNSLTVSIPENKRYVMDINASDADIGDTLSYMISGGIDSSKFSVDLATGELTFNQAPDYENPTDSDGDNSYVVDINVTDGSFTTTQTIIVNVTDISEAQAVDPYIVGAQFWADVDRDGIIDENETSTLSDKNGNFTFSMYIPDDTNVTMIKQGLHNGKLFDGNLSASFNNTAAIISPITSLGSVGFSDSEIIAVLVTNGMTDIEFDANISSSELYLDPFDTSLLPLDGNMSGYTDAQIQKFRRVLMANVAINSALTMLGGYGLDKGTVQTQFFDDPDGSGPALSPVAMMLQAGIQALSVDALRNGHARVMARIYVAISNYMRDRLAAVWGDDALVAQTLQNEMSNINSIVESLIKAYTKAYGYGMQDPKFGWVGDGHEYKPMLFIQPDELGFADVTIVYDDGSGNDLNITFAVNNHNYLEGDTVTGQWMVSDGKVLAGNSEYQLFGDTLVINSQSFEVLEVYYNHDNFKPAVTYTGSADPGDFANFSVDGNVLNYNITGAVYGAVQGSLTLYDATGNGVFFYGDLGGGNYVKVAKSDNLGIFIAPTDTEGNTTVVLGLQVPPTAINEADIVGKPYIYAEMGEDSGGGRYVDGYIVVLNQDYSINLYSATGNTYDGCWKALGNHVVVKVGATSNYCGADYALLDDTTSDVRVVIKPSENGGRSGFIADSVAGDFIGIGLEQRAIDISEMNGVFDAYWYDFEDDSETFVQVEVTNDGTNASYRLTPYVCDTNGCQLDSDTTHQITGGIEINQLCGGGNIDGIMCVDNTFMGFMDTNSGYFILSDDNSLIFGSKQLP